MIPEWMWIAWLAVAAGGFAVLETIRAWLGITPPSVQRRIAVPVFVTVLVLFVVWFIPHIVFNIL